LASAKHHVRDGQLSAVTTGVDRRGQAGISDDRIDDGRHACNPIGVFRSPDGVEVHPLNLASFSRSLNGDELAEEAIGGTDAALAVANRHATITPTCAQLMSGLIRYLTPASVMPSRSMRADGLWRRTVSDSVSRRRPSSSKNAEMASLRSSSENSASRASSRSWLVILR